MTKQEREAQKKVKRKAKREAKGLKTRQKGSLKSEMIHRIRQAASKPGEQLSHSYRDNAIHACAQFDEWRKYAGLSNNDVRDHKREAVKAWAQFLARSMNEDESKKLSLRRKKQAYAAASIHTMIAGVCMGLGIEMNGICRAGTVLDKQKSTGLSARAEKARSDSKNQDIVRFAQLVGGRRTAYSRLTGSDFLRDESGEYCVRFIHDKGKKTQYQRIAPKDVPEVAAYFDGKKSDELIFPEKIDKNLDLHAIRAEHARAEYERYANICSTPEGRERMRQQLWARFHDPVIGNKAWFSAVKNGNRAKARSKEKAFAAEMKDGTYWLQGANRQAALLKDRPIGYDRLALCCVSVFALSHWRNEVTVKHYMI